MHKFYCSSQNISSDKIILTDKEQAHHINDVLRLKVKDEVIIFDDNNNEYRAIIEKLSSQSVMCAIKEKHRIIPTQKPKITLACAIPKKSKFDDIVDKLTQLGVERIIPLLTQRVVVKLNKSKELLRQKRWEKIALCASQQSQRSSIPIVVSVKSIKEILSDCADYDFKIIPTLVGKQKPLKVVFANSHHRNILILIGPEGDFSPEEIDLAKKAGCIPVSLGDLVLRVETAAVAVASFIKLTGTHPQEGDCP